MWRGHCSSSSEFTLYQPIMSAFDLFVANLKCPQSCQEREIGAGLISLTDSFYANRANSNSCATIFRCSNLD